MNLFANLYLFFRFRTFFYELLYIIPLQLITIGFYLISQDRGFPEHSWIVLLTPTWLILGFALVKNKTVKIHSLTIENQEYEQKAFNFLLFLFTCATVYHFTRVGLVLFAEDVELGRFRLIAGSGFFGIPSRIVLFGIGALAFFGIVNRNRLSRFSVTFSWLLFMFSTFLLGFKGALIEVALVYFLAIYVRDQTNILKSKVKILLFSICSLSYAVWSATLYSSLRIVNNLDLGYMIERLTIIPALPQITTLKLLENNLLVNGAILNDFSYFTAKYFNIGQGVPFAFDQIVSSTIYLTRRGSTEFIVPVTTGGTPYLISSLPFFIVPFLCIFIGFTFSFAIKSLMRRASLIETIGYFQLVTLLGTFVLNGGGVYLFINHLTMFVTLATFLKAFRKLMSMDRSKRVSLSKIHSK